MPAVEIDIKGRPEKGEFFFDAAYIAAADIKLEFRQKGEYSFLNRTKLLAGGAEYFKAMTPRKLTLYGIKRVSGLIVNIIAVKTRKKGAA